MPLQSANLAMIGLGAVGNQPVNPYQTPLADGIHLRWAFRRELGFPWYGFHLFRRPAMDGQPLCLSKVTGGLSKGIWPEAKYATVLGVLSSNTNLVLTDDFAQPNTVEFALDGRSYLRFDFPAGEPARRVELRIGFRPQRCLDFKQLIALPSPTLRVGVNRTNPLNLHNVVFEVRDSSSQLAASTQFDMVNTTAGQLLGLACGSALTIKLPAPSNMVELQLTRTGTPAALEAYDSSNNKIATMQTQSPVNQPETIKLNGSNISRIEIRTPRGTTYLHRVCADSISVSGVPGGTARVTFYQGATALRIVSVSGQAGNTELVKFSNDAITSIEISPLAGSLVDLCYVPVTQDVTQGWQKLTGFSYPMGLPVTQPEYPCTIANPGQVLTQREPDTNKWPPSWNKHTPNELIKQLQALTSGGPVSQPMAKRLFDAPKAAPTQSDPNPPSLGRMPLLDLVLLGALHPALARMIGLYWIDNTADLNTAYDYLIVADHTGIGQRDPDKVLDELKASGFAQLDGYILFNKRKAAEPALPVPGGLKAYELPGGYFPNAQGELSSAINNSGLRWALPEDNTGSLLPESAVMYLVWRADLGNGPTPTPAGKHNLVTKLPNDKPKPILVTKPRLASGVTPQRSADWPSELMHYIDRNLPDGWYSYQVNGIDLFGRHSVNSAPVQRRLLEKIPPPSPPGVEASALDPLDPWLIKDFEHVTWYNSLSKEPWFTALPKEKQLNVIGLRVEWKWLLAQQRQSPNTKGFRIYFHPGTDLPAGHAEAKNWQQRFHVVDYNECFACINPTSRLFKSAGGTGVINVTAASGNNWSATTTDPWITITNGVTGTGNGVVTFSVGQVPSPQGQTPVVADEPRIGSIQVAGHTFFIYQADSKLNLPQKTNIVEGAKEDRAYQIFLPRISSTTPGTVPLTPSLSEPMVFAHIGISAADDKPHTKDHRTTGTFSNLNGNESGIGQVAKIYCILRTPPPKPVALVDIEKVYASPADYHSKSYYTYRWMKPEEKDNLRLHLFRALDDAICKIDWQIRATRRWLDPENAQHKRFFPSDWLKQDKTEDLVRKKTAANELNGIKLLTDYESLSLDAKALLIRLPGNDGAKSWDQLKARDWMLRRPRQSATVSDLSEFTGWDAAKRQAVAKELNAFVLTGSAATVSGTQLTLNGTQDLNAIRPYRDSVHLKSDTKSADRQYRILAVDVSKRILTMDGTPKFSGTHSAWTVPLYHTLSDSGLRALAMLPGNESAFVQVTIDPINSYEAESGDKTEPPPKLRWRDRRGPDTPEGFAIDEANRSAFIDTLDGRSINRYLYRAAFVDSAHNQSELGLPGPVVYLPNVVPPRTPVITKVLGGDRQITIKWASNREPDLAEYRIYRADSEEATRDLRLMILVHTETVPTGDPAARPPEVTWINTPVPGLVTFYYSLVSVDEQGNASDASRVLIGRAFDESRPNPPSWNPPVAESTSDVVMLSWTSSEANLACLVQRKVTATKEWKDLSVWLPRGTYKFTDQKRKSNVTYDYRLRVLDVRGRTNNDFIVITA